MQKKTKTKTIRKRKRRVNQRESWQGLGRWPAALPSRSEKLLPSPRKSRTRRTETTRKRKKRMKRISARPRSALIRKPGKRKRQKKKKSAAIRSACKRMMRGLAKKTTVSEKNKLKSAEMSAKLRMTGVKMKRKATALEMLQGSQKAKRESFTRRKWAQPKRSRSRSLRA